jgi:hypothetical protein
MPIAMIDGRMRRMATIRSERSRSRSQDRNLATVNETLRV